MQRKKYEKPDIVLLNVELELKSEKENAEIRVDNVEVSLDLVYSTICFVLSKIFTMYCMCFLTFG